MGNHRSLSQPVNGIGPWELGVCEATKRSLLGASPRRLSRVVQEVAWFVQFNIWSPIHACGWNNPVLWQKWELTETVFLKDHEATGSHGLFLSFMDGGEVPEPTLAREQVLTDWCGSMVVSNARKVMSHCKNCWGISLVSRVSTLRHLLRRRAIRLSIRSEMHTVAIRSVILCSLETRPLKTGVRRDSRFERCYLHSIGGI